MIIFKFNHYQNARWYNYLFIWLFKTINKLQEQYNEYCYPSDRIPSGYYCYRIERIIPSDDPNKPPRIKMIPCPYLELIDGYHEQECGYCKKTGIKDWEEVHLSLLWDGVKECGIKLDDSLDMIDVTSDSLKVL